MSGERFFTVEQANDLIPQLSHLMAAQMKLLTQIEEHVRALSDVIGPLDEASARPSDADPPAVRSRKEDLARVVQLYRDGWSRIEQTGAVIKDPRMGLLDFHAKIDGEAVFLCWQFGEPEIAWYHSLYTGYTARQRLPTAVAQPTLNSCRETVAHRSRRRGACGP